MIRIDPGVTVHVSTVDDWVTCDLPGDVEGESDRVTVETNGTGDPLAETLGVRSVAAESAGFTDAWHRPNGLIHGGE